MKRYSVIALFLLCAGIVFAQETTPNASQIGITAAQQYLKEISVDKFEYDGYWRSVMSSDQGYVTSRLFKGGPLLYNEEANPNGKKLLEEEANLGLQDDYVLGARVDFLRRGYSSVSFYPTRPIPIEGITKTISIWVAGRNFNHELKILIQDYFGRQFELSAGKLNFQGWKKLTVAVPAQAPDGQSGIVQRNYHFHNNMGIKIIGLRIEFDQTEAFGTYYVYFDDLRAVTDLFAEDDRDQDDMVDAW